MVIRDVAKQAGRGLAVAAAVVAAVSVSVPNPAKANVSPGWAAAIGLGSFALGTALGAASNTYYSPYYYQ